MATPPIPEIPEDVFKLLQSAAYLREAAIFPRLSRTAKKISQPSPQLAARFLYRKCGKQSLQHLYRSFPKLRGPRFPIGHPPNPYHSKAAAQIVQELIDLTGDALELFGAFLEVSVRFGHADVVKALKEQIVPIDDWVKFTLLIDAAARGYVDTVKALLEVGCNPDLHDYDTPLDVAVLAGRVETAKALLEGGAKVTDGLPAMAGWCEQVDMVRFLVEWFRSKEEDASQPAPSTPSGQTNPTTLQPNPNVPQRPTARSSRTPKPDDSELRILIRGLWEAFFDNDHEYKCFQDVDNSLLEPCTPKNRIEVVEYLLQNDLLSYLTSDSIVHTLCEFANPRNDLPFHLLLKYGIDINTIDGRGHTALSQSFITYTPPAIKLLLEHGADPSIIPPSVLCDVMSKITYATHQGYYNAALFLIDHCPRSVDYEWQPYRSAPKTSPVGIAMVLCDAEIMRRLVAQGVKIPFDVFGKDGGDEKMLGDTVRKAEYLGVLLDNELDPSVLLERAIKENVTETVELMVQKGAVVTEEHVRAAEEVADGSQVLAILRNAPKADKGSKEDRDAESEDDRPECQYGQKCYRKNPAHFKEFAHPCSDEKKSNGGLASESGKRKRVAEDEGTSGEGTNSADSNDNPAPKRIRLEDYNFDDGRDWSPHQPQNSDDEDEEGEEDDEDEEGVDMDVDKEEEAEKEYISLPLPKPRCRFYCHATEGWEFDRDFQAYPAQYIDEATIILQQLAICANLPPALTIKEIYTHVQPSLDHEDSDVRDVQRLLNGAKGMNISGEVTDGDPLASADFDSRLEGIGGGWVEVVLSQKKHEEGVEGVWPIGIDCGEGERRREDWCDKAEGRGYDKWKWVVKVVGKAPGGAELLEIE
ncbi:hypothetical protein HDV00_006086 [Rhizophlyctis rosea]|nr:hypothetical protein HDV00_006086 [Rhizophlyctis rosea]